MRMFARTNKGGGGHASADKGKGVNFLRFCADVFYEWSLINTIDLVNIVVLVETDGTPVMLDFPEMNWQTRSPKPE